VVTTVPVDWQGHHQGDLGRNLRREHENPASCRIAIFSLGIDSAYAGDGDGNLATTLFTSIQNNQAAAASSVATQTSTIAVQSGAATQAPDARSQGQGTWLFRVFSLP
jgi:hypothetical protein